MATVLLGSIGTIIGGPLGGAIGSLVGQQIDRALIGGTVRGPRLGDLSVQTSSYGTAIPRIYGTMRVAGTVVWSTDLKEHQQTSGSTISYTYTVSLAVALSSRPLQAVKRIWADGKLIRDQNGKFSVKTKFRSISGT